MKPFQELAAAIEAEWSRHQFAGEVFSDIAAEALRAARLPERVRPAEVLGILLTGTEVPEVQVGENQGDHPTFTLARRDRFRIEARFWPVGPTSLQSHQNVGAFQVYFGWQLRSLYHFEPVEEPEPGFELGTLTRQTSELVPQGGVRVIGTGEAFAHDAIFLEPLCLTLVVRANSEPILAPDRFFLPSCRYRSDSRAWRRVEVVQAIQKAGAWRSSDRVVATIRSGLSNAFGVLLAVVDALGNSQFEELAQLVVEVHGVRALPLVEAVREHHRRERVAHALRWVTDFEQRLLLALSHADLSRVEAAEVVRATDPTIEPFARLDRAGDALRHAFPNLADLANRIVLPLVGSTVEPVIDPWSGVSAITI